MSTSLRQLQVQSLTKSRLYPRSTCIANMTGKQHRTDKCIPKLLVGLNVTVGEECNPREGEVLVVDEHLHWS